MTLEVEHALSCRFGRLPIRRHNEVRNLLASCLRKAGWDTTIEPLLQPLSGKVFHRRTTTGPRCAPGHKGQWISGVGGARGSIFWRKDAQPHSLPRTAPYLFHPGEGEARPVWGESPRSGEGGVHTTGFLGDRRSSQTDLDLLEAIGSMNGRPKRRGLQHDDGMVKSTPAFSLLCWAVVCLRSSRGRVSFDTEDLQPGLAIGLAGTGSHW